MPNLTTLIPELIFDIADHLEKRTEINSLCQTSRQLHMVANPYLYRCAVLSGKLTLHQTLFGSIGALNPNAGSRPGQILINPQETVEGQKWVDSRLKVLREIIEILLEAGADVNAVSSPQGGLTALHVAVWTGDNEIVELLLCAGADIRRMAEDGDTALHKAATGKASRGTVELLLKNGAAVDIDSWNLRGQTPLHVAAAADSETVALALLENGANVNASGYMLGTPLHVAVHPSTRYYLVGSCRVSRMMKILLERGADVDAVDNNGMTALAIVLTASNKDGKTIRCLLANWASVDLTDANGQRVRGLSCSQRAYRRAKQVQWGFESLKKRLTRLSSLEWAKKKPLALGLRPELSW